MDQYGSALTFNLTHPSNYFNAVTFGTIGFLGGIGNLALTVLILSDYKNRKPYEWMIFALATNDFLLCLNSVALQSPFVIDFNRVECKISAVFNYWTGSLSFHIPLFVAYNRYLSLYDQPKCTRLFTCRNIVIGCVFLMIFDFLCWISPFIAMDALGQDELGACGLQIRNNILAGVMLVLCATHFMSYGFLVYCTRKVIMKIRGHKKEVASRSQIQSRLITESREIITVVTIISIVPLFAQVPASTVKILEIFTPYFGPWINRILVGFFPLPAAVNAFVTLYVIRHYRKIIIKFFKKLNGSAVTNTVNPA